MSESADCEDQSEIPGWLGQDFYYEAKSNVWTLKTDSGTFGYSDGDKNEEYLLSVFRNAESCAVMSEDLTTAMRDWPSTYHLHHQRCNLFRPFPDLIRGPILEIGAGCGALTRFLGEKGEAVYAVEGSARRASIVGERCRDLPNVTVLNTNFLDLRTENKFQTITLIGVLEYARLYFRDKSDADPVEQMLRRVFDLLSEDGVLFIAIENQLGLKYFAGFPEDHLGIPMSGIEEHYHAASVVTFGKEELAEKLSNAGFSAKSFAYPFPDYKFPETILSNKALTGPNAERYAALIAGSLMSDRQKPDRLNFRMSKAIGPIVRNGLGPELANSFLIMCSKSEDALMREFESDASYFGNGDRKMPYLKSVEFVGGERSMSVKRRTLTNLPQPESASVVQVLEDEVFVDGDLWGNKLQDILVRKDWSLDEVEEWAKVWFDALKRRANLPAEAKLTPDSDLDGAWLDAIPKNLIVDEDGTGHFVDLEWHAKSSLTLGFILVRGLSDSFSSIEFANRSRYSADIASMVVDLCARLSVPMTRTEVQAHLQKEEDLQKEISYRPRVGSKVRFVRTSLSYSSITRLAKLNKGLSHIAYLIRRPGLMLAYCKGRWI